MPKVPLESQPKIDVIIPFHQVNDYLFEAIASLNHNLGVDYRVILVDDTQSEIELKFNCISRNHIVVKNGIKGYKNAILTGFRTSQAEYLAFVDSDDLIDPSKLDLQYQEILKNDSDVISCEIQKIRLSFFGVRKMRSPLGPTPREVDPRILLMLSSHGADSSILIKRSKFEEGISNFREAPSTHADYALMASLDCKTRFSRIEKPLYYYRMSKHQMSRTTAFDGDWSVIHAAWLQNLNCLAKKYVWMSRYKQVSEKFTWYLLNAHYCHPSNMNERSELRTFFDDLLEDHQKMKFKSKCRWKIYLAGRRFLCLRECRFGDMGWLLVWMAYAFFSLVSGNVPRRLKS